MKQLKVFHGLVNYGTQSGLFAKTLRKQGIDAISVTTSDPFKRQTDIELTNNGKGIRNIIIRIYNRIRLVFWFFKYNTFHFYYGTTLWPKQRDLPFYRMLGKKVIMEYLGNDIQGYKKSVEKYKWTNMPAFIENDDPNEYDSRIEKRLAFETKYTDLQFVCAPIYSEFVRNSIVLPLSIDLDNYPFTEHPQNKTITIMHAPTDRGSKGTEFIIEAVQRLISEGKPVILNLVENVTHVKLIDEYIKSDIFIDQINSGWYGAAAIEAMAIGRPVICSIRKSYYEFIDYGEQIPIVHADPDTIYDSINNLISNRSKLPELGSRCRQFVEKIHDNKKLTKKLIEYYKNIS